MFYKSQHYSLSQQLPQAPLGVPHEEMIVLFNDGGLIRVCAHVPKAQFVYVTEAQHTGEPQVEAALPGVSKDCSFPAD